MFLYHEKCYSARGVCVMREKEYTALIRPLGSELEPSDICGTSGDGIYFKFSQMARASSPNS